MLNADEILQSGKNVIDIEAKALLQLKARLDHRFVEACRFFLSCDGRVIVTGMGKSGHIAKKIAATLASTGTPAFFIHPAEANHGDVGMITRRDMVLALSYSGNTQELLTLVPLIKRLGIPLISLTGHSNSPLAKASTLHLDVSIDKEACPLNLAPTASTTTALAMGDAMAITLLKARGFTAEDFAFSHPGGRLGRRLLLRVSDLMRTHEHIPFVTPTTPLLTALIDMSLKGLGATLVIGENDSPKQAKLLGIYTDGDLRRSLEQYTTSVSQGIPLSTEIFNEKIENLMTTAYKTITADALAAEALQLMESHKITLLPVVNEQKIIEGVVHLHDVIAAGVV